MKRERVLFMISSMGAGGAERVVQLLMNYYCKNYVCDLFVVSGNSCAYDLDPRINVIYLDKRGTEGGVGNKLGRVVLKRRYVNQYIHEKEADGWKYVLVTAHLNMAYILAALCCKAKETIYVIHNPQKHNKGSNSFLYIKVFNYFWKNKRIGAVSQGIKKELIEQYGIPSEQIKIVNNPVDKEKIGEMQQASFSQHRDYILAIGRLTLSKNYVRLLEVYNAGKFYQKYDLVILGEGELRAEITEKISQLNLQKYVVMMGYCENPYVWMRHAKLLLNTSDYEALPMTLIEAMVVGTKVVSADCDYGPNEILVDELKDYLVNPITDIEQYVEKINKALVIYPEIKAKYFQRFLIDKVATTYMNIFW